MSSRLANFILYVCMYVNLRMCVVHLILLMCCVFDNAYLSVDLDIDLSISWYLDVRIYLELMNVLNPLRASRTTAPPGVKGTSGLPLLSVFIVSVTVAACVFQGTLYRGLIVGEVLTRCH